MLTSLRYVRRPILAVLGGHLVVLRRFYSDQRPPHHKYRSIEDFNSAKKEYLFGHNLDEKAPQVAQHASKTPEDHPEAVDVNSLIEKDPRLADLKPGSPDYKDMMHQLHQEYDQKFKKEQKASEQRERIKAVGIGLLAVVSLVSLHQLVMNFEYVKKSLSHKWTFRDVDGSRANDLSDPKNNTKRIDYLIDQLVDQLADDKISSTLVASKESAGLYLFGASNGRRFPVRVPFFDHMMIRDVNVLHDYLIVVDCAGKVYHLHRGLKEPQAISLPSKVVKAEVSGDLVYYLTTKGSVLCSPRLDRDAAGSFRGSSLRNWLGLSRSYASVKLAVDETVKDFSTGDSHLLILGKSGSLYVANTSTKVQNYGQFGMPSLSPFSEAGKSIPVNKVYELSLLNNEVVSGKNGVKSLKPRVFNSIASGKFHNIASDTDGNVWAWGKNSFGECGLEVSYNNDIQPIPKKILTRDDLNIAIRNSKASSKAKLRTTVAVDELYAADESSFIKVRVFDEDESYRQFLLGFGNGIKGQLGISRYLHVSPRPTVIKALVDLTEYNEELEKVTHIDIKDVSVGNNHVFVTLNNSGNLKDVLTFGDNEFGQFGNGKVVKSSKPILVPLLIEPKDLESNDKKSKRKLARKLNDVVNSRLQLLDNAKVGKNQAVEQVVVAGENGSAIFYRTK